MLRIKKIRVEKNCTINDLSVKTGISKRMISAYEANENDITLQKLQNIASALSVNILDLIEEESNSLLYEPVKPYSLRTDNDIDIQLVPLFNFEATASIVTLFKNHNQEGIIGNISIPNIPKCDGAIHITGDSMYPLLKSGDIIMYKQIQDLKDCIIFWGEMYLISFDVDGEEHITVKWCQKSDQGPDYIRLVSENKNHQPIDIPRSSVRALALVKASVRINAMN